MKKTLNLAHRGFSGEYPENTMLAFEEAVKTGCDGIETDLHISKDGVIVICHDEKIDRTTDGKGLIADYNYKELCKFNAGVKFEKNEKIPTLDEFLDFIKDKNLFINMELKNNIIVYPNLEEMVIKKIYEYGILDNVILSSFNHYSMVKVKKLDPAVKTGLLYSATLYDVQIYAKSLNADAVHPFFPALQDEGVVKKIKDSGLKINTYTVNEEEHMKKLIEYGIDGIITNYPDKLKRLCDAI